MFKQRERLRRLARAWPLVAMLAAPAVAVQVPFVRHGVVSLAMTMHHGGLAGFGLYAVCYVFGALLTAPVALFHGLAGFAWGPVYGPLVAVPTGTVAATGAFVLGRALARTDRAKRWLDDPRMKLVSAVASADGLRIATLLRLTPLMPQNLLSYALGTTPLRAWQFALATFVGLAPHATLQAYVGSMVHDAAELLQRDGGSLRDPHTWGPPLAGLCLTGALMALVTRYTRRALSTAVTTDRDRTGASTPPAS